MTYSATVEFENHEYDTEYEAEVDPLGHDYGEPEWDWQDDGTGGMTATAIFYCNRNPEHVLELPAEMTEEATANGTLYTATVICQGVEYSDQRLIG